MHPRTNAQNPNNFQIESCFERNTTFNLCLINAKTSLHEEQLIEIKIKLNLLLKRNIVTRQVSVLERIKTVAPKSRLNILHTYQTFLDKKVKVFA